MAKLVCHLTIMSLSMALLLPLRGQCEAAATAAATGFHVVGTTGATTVAAAERSCGRKTGKRQQPQVEGMFVFGSSLVDNGNNNFLNGSGVRADYLPYGVDFPLGPSGRFSNGRNVIDALGELLRLPGLVPPFADPRTRGGAGLHGVNFASGGSGILDHTGQLTGEVMSLRQQISNFEAVTLPDLRAQLLRGAAATARIKGQDSFQRCYLSKCLFIIGTGGNDYLLNYFNPRKNGTEDGPPLAEFTSSLITKLSDHLQRLYGLGARKFVIFSIQPTGCTPVVRAFLNITGAACIEPVNDAVALFNSELRRLVDGARSRMPAARLAYIDSYKIIKDTLDHPAKHGVRETGRACCEMSRTRSSSGVLCKKRGPVCRDRTEYVFFDGLHPTDAVNARIARKGYGSSSPEHAYPINVKKLAML
ncbi:GDSL esterase/lipase [Dichanthelium oligosanthes]|uniref:GDSL esterase/lipase n=1 Tax=Dichanthelium oligosanthes TaxID=888268 RepID=A0A1E5UKK1_9POAL|nr:GDSL esterase/lipase [Dichanthelium oligosanthes]